MCSHEDRMKAVQLYITYVVVRELGYPSPKNLRRWYRTYVETGGLPEEARPKPKYSIEQKQRAVDYYFSHGIASPRTTRAPGYSCVEMLGKQIDELHPDSMPAFAYIVSKHIERPYRYDGSSRHQVSVGSPRH